jgi:hypothetical protein
VMRYSTGLSDSLFGEKITLQGPDEKGTIVKLIVTKKWLEHAQGGSKISSSQEKVNNGEYSPSLV